MQLTKFKKNFSHYLYERKKFSVAEILIRSFIQEQLQLSHVKHKQLPPQVLLPTLTHDDQIKFKPVHCLFKQETVLGSLKDDCHPGLAHFRFDQFPIGNDNEGEKNVIETLDPFSVDAVQPLQVPFKKPITRNAKTLIQQFFSGADNEDPVGRRKPQDNMPYRTDLVLIQKVDYEKRTTTSLKINPCTSEKCIDSEDGKLQMKNIHQTNPSVREQSLNNSSFDPFFFKHISQFNYFVLLLLLHWMKIQY